MQSRLTGAICAAILALTLPAAAHSASAADEAAVVSVANAAFDASLTLGGRTLHLNGAGLRKILFIKVYAAGLYLEAPAKTADDAMAADGPRRVRLALLRDVSGSDFIEALEEGLNANLTPEKKAEIADDAAALKTLMTAIGDVKEGDVVDFDYLPEEGTIVSRCGKRVGGAIAGKPLYDAVLAIWLGESPIDDSLKAGLLGL